MKKKICFLTDTIFSIGGIQRCVSVLTNSLIDADYEVHILCTDTRYHINYDMYNLNKKVMIYIVPYSKMEKYLFSWTKIIKNKSKKDKRLQTKINLLKFCFYLKNKTLNKNIINYINKKNIDIVIGAGGNQSILLAILKEKINAKIYGWQHSSCESYFENQNGSYYAQRKLFKKYINKLDNYIVLTQSDQNWIKKHFKYNATCIFNPKSFSSSKTSTLKNKTFISVGRYDKVKGYERLIEAFYIFAQNNNDWSLKIIGEGPLKEELQEKINSLHMEHRIELVPKTDHIIDYYLNSSVYLLSSYYEGLPMVLIEACECGLPIISYNLPCCSEQFSICSLIINNNNVEEYADAMKKIVNDQKLLSELAHNAKKNSLKYDITNILKEWEKIL